MLAKLSFCAHEELAKAQVETIMATLPKPIIAFSEEGWEEVWEFNHELASKIKHACRLKELGLDILAWDAAKGKIMLEIAKKKFSQLYLKFLICFSSCLL